MSGRVTFKDVVTAAAAAGLLGIPTGQAGAVGRYGPDEVPIAVLASVDQPTVAQYLGEPSRCDWVKRGNVCYYRAGAVEVLFIGGLADWFTVCPRDTPYDPSSLAHLGLASDHEPTFGNQHLIQWHGVGGVFEVTMYQGNNGEIEYFHVKARTP